MDLKILSYKSYSIDIHSFLKADRVGRTTTRASRRMTKSPTRYTPSRKSPSRRSPARQSARSPGRSPTSTSRKLPIRSTRLAKISLSRIDVESGKYTYYVFDVCHVYSDVHMQILILVYE